MNRTDFKFVVPLDAEAYNPAFSGTTTLREIRTCLQR